MKSAISISNPSEPAKSETGSSPMTWTHLFACFSNSDSKLQKVAVQNTDGDYEWLAPGTASATASVGQARAVQAVTVGADSSRTTWRARLSRLNVNPNISDLERLKQYIQMMSAPAIVEN